MIQCYHLLNTFQFLLTDQLITTVRWLFVVLLGFVLVSVFCVSLGLVSLLLYTVTALWIMYRSTQAPFDAHCHHDFFSSGTADHALRLGPYMRRSSY